ncbi:hypothetical protein A4A49_03768 [Nicotiana attenuata]|uniref:Uncharacterized protein n=1 Tax=Nicotiana attenuata TaxID=49451 RepID=A0A1J6I5Y9_NICAT|nr:hypothetical protein A4A49_03768 [Nicotiana attenuata]
MQARKNKYKRDKRGYIIDESKMKEDNKGKGKDKEEAVMSRNKFEALEVDETAQPILTIAEGKVENNGKDKGKEQESKGTSKAQQQEKKDNGGDHSPNPNSKGIKESDLKKVMGKVGDNTSLNKEEFDARRVKKEAVDNANKEREAALCKEKLNPTPLGNQLSTTKGALVDHHSTGPTPIDSGSIEEARKESTIDWVHRRFGTSKEELRQCNVTTNHSCQDIPTQTYEDAELQEDANEVSSRKVLWSEEVDIMEEQQGVKKVMVDKEEGINNQMKKTGTTGETTVNPSRLKTRVDCSVSSMELQAGKSIGGGSGTSNEAGNQEGLVAAPLSIEKGNGTVTTNKTGEILAFVDGVPVYAVEKGYDEGVHIDVRKDTVGSDLQTDQRKGGDPNGTVTQAVSVSCATVNPNLSSVYELQFKIMQEKLGEVITNSEQLEAALTPYEPGEHAIVARESEALPMACSSGNSSPLQIKVNVPLKSPN